VHKNRVNSVILKFVQQNWMLLFIFFCCHSCVNCLQLHICVYCVNWALSRVAFKCIVHSYSRLKVYLNLHAKNILYTVNCVVAFSATTRATCMVGWRSPVKNSLQSRARQWVMWRTGSNWCNFCAFCFRNLSIEHCTRVLTVIFV